MRSCEEYKALMMGLMDNELTPEELREVKTHLERCRECREEYQQLKNTSALLPDLTYEPVHDKELDAVWKQPYSRISKLSGILLIIVSWFVFLGFSLYSLFTDTGEPKTIKIAIAAAVLGFGVLLVSAVRDRIATYRTDPYREVKR